MSERCVCYFCAANDLPEAYFKPAAVTEWLNPAGRDPKLVQRSYSQVRNRYPIKQRQSVRTAHLTWSLEMRQACRSAIGALYRRSAPGLKAILAVTTASAPVAETAAHPPPPGGGGQPQADGGGGRRTGRDTVPTLDRDRHDLADDGVEIGRQRRGRIAQHLHLPVGAPGVAHAISFGSIAPSVNFAVDLDRQPCRRAIKVEHIRSGRTLAAEAQAGIVPAEGEPQRDLRWRHRPTKARGVTPGIIGPFEPHRRPPPPSAFGCHLPLAGEDVMTNGRFPPKQVIPAKAGIHMHGAGGARRPQPVRRAWRFPLPQESRG